MKVRQAGRSDLDAVVQLTCRAYAHYEPLLGGKPIPVTEDYGPRIANGEVWLLEDGKEPIGLLVLEHQGDRSYLFSVAVTPERQGAGIGRDLVRQAEELARRRGHGTLALHTNAKMERNLRIYSLSGFRETDRRPHPQRAGWTVVHMEKQLADPIRQAGS